MPIGTLWHKKKLKLQYEWAQAVTNLANKSFVYLSIFQLHLGKRIFTMLNYLYFRGKSLEMVWLGSKESDERTGKKELVRWFGWVQGFVVVKYLHFSNCTRNNK